MIPLRISEGLVSRSCVSFHQPISLSFSLTHTHTQTNKLHTAVAVCGAAGAFNQESGQDEVCGDVAIPPAIHLSLVILIHFIRCILFVDAALLDECRTFTPSNLTASCLLDCLMHGIQRI